MKKKRKLRNYLIKNDIQLRVGFTSLIYMILIIMVTMGIAFQPTITTMLDSSIDIGARSEAAKVLLNLLNVILPAILIACLLIFIHLIVILHRICGPLVSFSKFYGRVKNGNYDQPLKLRKNDFLKKECREFNDMQQSLNQRKMDQEKTDAEILKALSSIHSVKLDDDCQVAVKKCIDLLKVKSSL